MKIRPLGVELFQVEFRDKRSDMVKPKAAFHNSVNMTKTWTAGNIARGWLRNCAANRKVAGLIPDGVTGIFIDLSLPASLRLWCQLGLYQESIPYERVIIGVILLVYVYTRHMQQKYTYNFGKNV